LENGSTTFVLFKFGVVQLLEKDLETLELGPAHCYSSDPAGPPDQLLQCACITPGRKAERHHCRSPTSPPRFPRHLFIDRRPQSHATHLRCANGSSPPTVSPHVHRLSDIDCTASFICAHHLLRRCRPFSRHRPQALNAPRACPPSDLFLRVPGL
jgi:hypothetical protein